jgi:hypothetical protein
MTSRHEKMLSSRSVERIGIIFTLNPYWKPKGNKQKLIARDKMTVILLRSIDEIFVQMQCLIGSRTIASNLFVGIPSVQNFRLCQ